MDAETVVFIALALLSAPAFAWALWIWRTRRRMRLERRENMRRNKIWRKWQKEGHE